jgi:hypothetical protein
MPLVLLELVGLPGMKEYVAVVTLNRPDAKNALNKELSLKLASMLGELRDREDIRVCILMGAGHCFCAGESRPTPVATHRSPSSEAISHCPLPMCSYCATGACYSPGICSLLSIAIPF